MKRRRLAAHSAPPDSLCDMDRIWDRTRHGQPPLSSFIGLLIRGPMEVALSRAGELQNASGSISKQKIAHPCQCHLIGAFRAAPDQEIWPWDMVEIGKAAPPASNGQPVEWASVIALVDARIRAGDVDERCRFTTGRYHGDEFVVGDTRVRRPPLVDGHNRRRFTQMKVLLISRQSLQSGVSRTSFVTISAARHSAVA